MYFFLIYYFGRTTLFQTFQWTSSDFIFIPEFIAEILKPNKNQRERSPILQYIFAQKISLILRISTLLKLKIICTQNTAKKLSQSTNFRANMFLFGVRKKHLHCIISWRPRTTFLKHCEIKCLYISVYLSKKILFQRPSKILYGGMGGWWRLNNFLKGACCLRLLKCFTIFYFNWIFLKFNNFSVFQYFHQ